MHSTALTEAIVAFARKHIDGTNSWYEWKRDLPSNSCINSLVDLPQGANDYARTIVLKQQLHEHWQQNDDPAYRKCLAEAFVRDWGGIRTNDPAKIAEYARRPADGLIAAYGEEGIASWSKVLVLRDPEKYAIYDSRVAASLNSLQQRHDTEDKVWFPDVRSQAGGREEQIPLLKEHAQKSNWKYAGKQKFPGFYKCYLAVLREVVQRLQAEGCPTDGIQTVEMLLFSQADRLLLQAVRSLGGPIS